MRFELSSGERDEVVLMLHVQTLIAGHLMVVGAILATLTAGHYGASGTIAALIYLVCLAWGALGLYISAMAVMTMPDRNQER